MMLDQLRGLIAQLRFHGMEAALDAEIERAERDRVVPVELLYQDVGRGGRIRAPAQSRLSAPAGAHAVGLDPARKLPIRPSAGGRQGSQIQTLAGLDFLRRADNLLLVGPPGTGKTGIGLGLLREACVNGYRGRFYNAQALLDELYASLADRSSPRLLQRLSRFQPLLIDELSYLTLKPEQIDMFFRLIDQRYLRVSTIITTNLDLPAWYDLFQKKELVDALLDRLRHRCIIIRINGPSLRAPPSEPNTTHHPPPHTAPTGRKPSRSRMLK